MSAATGFEERLDRVLERHRELGQALSTTPPPPPAELAQLSREYTQLSPIVEAIEALRAVRGEADDLQAMADDPESEPEMRALAEEERAALMEAIPEKEEALKLLLLPADEA
ncbi:MAG: PCRF domain-containing protein, partial [Rhodospirillales bacterium]|nr:PCRF domain-containing protein [Rhodospirillales bacterium]